MDRPRGWFSGDRLHKDRLQHPDLPLGEAVVRNRDEVMPLTLGAERKDILFPELSVGDHQRLPAALLSFLRGQCRRQQAVDGIHDRVLIEDGVLVHIPPEIEAFPHFRLGNRNVLQDRAPLHFLQTDDMSVHLELYEDRIHGFRGSLRHSRVVDIVDGAEIARVVNIVPDLFCIQFVHTSCDGAGVFIRAQYSHHRNVVPQRLSVAADASCVLFSGDPASRGVSVQRRQGIPCDAADKIAVLGADITLVGILPERSHVGFSHDAAGMVFLRGNNSCIFGVKDRCRYAEGIVQRSAVIAQDILVGIKIILHSDGPGNAAGLRIPVNIRSISAGDDPGGGIHGIGGVVEDAAVVRDIVQPVSFIFHEVRQAGEPPVDLVHVRDDLKTVLPGTGVHAVDLAGNAVQSGIDIVARSTHSFVCLEIDIDAACHVGNGTAET